MPLNRHTYSFPTRIEYGPGAMLDLTEIIMRTGMNRGLLVTDEGIEKVGTAERLRVSLAAAGIKMTTYSGVKPNPVEDNVLEGTLLYKESDSQFIIGLGGGSPIDAGKTIKCMATHEGPLAKYDDSKGGDAFIKDNMPPFYAIPTTAGTGSEVGRSSVITVKSTNTKTIIFSPYLMPTVAVLDPEIIVSLPPHLTAATGVDAFVHNLEAYIMETYHPFADALAKEGIARCFEHLPGAVENGDDLASRGEMLMASAMGATAFQKGLGINHSIAHALGVLYDTHHGLANAAILVEVMKFNIAEPAVNAKIAALGTILNTANDADAVLAGIEQWLVRVGMPTELSGMGVERSHVKDIEAYALADPCCSLNPRKVKPGDVSRIVEKLI